MLWESTFGLGSSPIGVRELPTGKPATAAPIVSAELRSQFTALKASLDAQQAQINALQAQLAQAAKNPNLGEFDPGFADPPTTADLNAIKDAINGIISGLNW